MGSQMNGGGQGLNRLPFLFCKSVNIDYGSLRCHFSEKLTFLIIFGQNCKNTTAKTVRNKDKGGFLV